jgi:hypothetical protein
VEIAWALLNLESGHLVIWSSGDWVIDPIVDPVIDPVSVQSLIR